MSEMQERINDYLAFGVAHIWLLDPRTRRAYPYTAGEICEVKDGILRAGQIALPLQELFD